MIDTSTFHVHTKCSAGSDERPELLCNWLQLVGPGSNYVRLMFV